MGVTAVDSVVRGQEWDASSKRMRNVAFGLDKREWNNRTGDPKVEEYIADIWENNAKRRGADSWRLIPDCRTTCRLLSMMVVPPGTHVSFVKRILPATSIGLVERAQKPSFQLSVNNVGRLQSMYIAA